MTVVVKFFFLLLFGMLLTDCVDGNQWVDPSWEQMIRDAEVIGLFEVTKGGLNEAVIQPAKILKGEVEKEGLYLSNFNDLYLPEDAQKERSLREGSKLYFFLSRRWKYKYDEWGRSFDPDSDATKALFVPSPTAGILELENEGKVRFSLFGTSYSWLFEKRDAESFERFLVNAIVQETGGNVSEGELSFALSKIRENLGEPESQEGDSDVPYWIAVYRHWGGDGLVKEIESALTHFHPGSRFEAARLIGKSLPDPKAKDWLVRLLDDSETLVQGEAVGQLMAMKGDKSLGEIFTKNLAAALGGGTGPGNVMDPVLNSRQGGLLAMVEAISEIGYKPAEKELGEVLRMTQSPTVLREAFNALDSLGSDLWIEGVNYHLLQSDGELRKEAISICDENPRAEFRQNLEGLLDVLERDSFEVGYVIRSLNFVESIPSISRWIEVLLEEDNPDTFDDEKCEYALRIFGKQDPDGTREIVERMMYYWTGVDSVFAGNPEILRQKERIEKEVCDRVSKVNSPWGNVTQNTYSVVWLSNRKEMAKRPDLEPHYSFKVESVIEGEGEKYPTADWDDIGAFREEIATHTGIPSELVGVSVQVAASAWNVSNTDMRIHGFRGSDLFNGFIDYSKYADSKWCEELLKFYLDSGLAKRFEVEEKIKNYLKPR